MFIQQGDVIFSKVDRVPSGAKSTNRRILVEGEHTGHNHTLATDAQVMTHGFSLFVIVASPVEVVHPEHGTVMLDPGVWEVGQVQEYDHFSEEAQKVID